MVRLRDRAAQYAQHDFPDFAQEFLRRNAEYRAQHAAASRDADIEKRSRAWGLHFPVRPCCRPEECTSILARRCLPVCPAHQGADRNRLASCFIITGYSCYRGGAIFCDAKRGWRSPH